MSSCDSYEADRIMIHGYSCSSSNPLIIPLIHEVSAFHQLLDHSGHYFTNIRHELLSLSPKPTTLANVYRYLAVLKTYTLSSDEKPVRGVLPTQPMPVPSDSAGCCAAISTDGSRFVVGYRSGQIRMFDSTSGTLLWTQKAIVEQCPIIWVRIVTGNQVIVEISSGLISLLKNGNIICQCGPVPKPPDLSYSYPPIAVSSDGTVLIRALRSKRWVYSHGMRQTTLILLRVTGNSLSFFTLLEGTHGLIVPSLLGFSLDGLKVGAVEMDISPPPQERYREIRSRSDLIFGMMVELDHLRTLEQLPFASDEQSSVAFAQSGGDCGTSYVWSTVDGSLDFQMSNADGEYLTREGNTRIITRQSDPVRELLPFRERYRNVYDIAQRQEETGVDMTRTPCEWLNEELFHGDIPPELDENFVEFQRHTLQNSEPQTRSFWLLGSDLWLLRHPEPRYKTALDWLGDSIPLFRIPEDYPIPPSSKAVGYQQRPPPQSRRDTPILFGGSKALRGGYENHGRYHPVMIIDFSKVLEEAEQDGILPVRTYVYPVTETERQLPDMEEHQKILTASMVIRR